MTRPILVGVDVGTTDTKAILTCTDGRTLGFARRATEWTTAAGGRQETTGAAMVAGVLAVVADALAQLPGRSGDDVRVVGLGIAGLAESGVLLDGHGRETSPVIAWFDDRGTAELAAADAGFLAAFPGRTGLPVAPQWTLAKLLWMRGAGLPVPAARRWLNVPEFVAWSLTGEQVSEPSLASRTGLVDQGTGRPWDDALAVAGVRDGLLPPSVPAGTAAGRIRECAAIPELTGAVVTVAGHDHPVAAVGAGAVGPEDLFDSCGTAEVLLRSVPRVLTGAERATLVGLGIDAGTHALPGHAALMGGMRSGLVMRRVLALLGADDPAGRKRLDDAWRPDAPGADRVGVAGGRVGDDDVTLRLRDGAGPDAAWAATLDHLAVRSTDLLAAIASVVGEHRAAVAAGGWTRMRSVREQKNRTIPRLTFCAVEQPGARGAALFAACAAEDGATVADVAARFARTASAVPDRRRDAAELSVPEELSDIHEESCP
jgi:sugar (pentulose or hexulose) kinase